MRRTHRRWMAMLGLVGLVVVSIGSHVTAAPERTGVCHRDDTGGFALVSLPTPAVAAHLKHGDALPGDPVPGNPRFVFDDTCAQVSACPCNFSLDALAEVGIDSGSPIACAFTGAGLTGLRQGTSLAGVDPRAGQAFCLRRSDSILESFNLTTADEVDACEADLQDAATALNITASCSPG